MKVKIITLGCKLNFAESSQLMNTLLAKGHQRAKAGEQADLVIINTCTVTDTADHKDRQAIHRAKRENPNAQVIVTGCYARLKPAEIANMLEVDHVIPKTEDKFIPAYSKDDRTRCFLKVQDGCNYFCTYCTIPMARGRSRNPFIHEVVEQAQLAIQGGAKEIVLTGVNIGDFGRSTNEHFIDLLRALDQIEGHFRIRISSCEPNLLTDEIIDFVAHSQHFAPHFHIPLQSGSDAVLKIMHRHYDTALFRDRIMHIKTVMPEAFIGVDCMVGVRGETEDYWQEYIQFIQSLPVTQLHVFTYSERANTKMLEMDLCVIPNKVRQQRSKVLHQISQEKLSAFYQQQIGKTATVLWESKKQGDMMVGFTENYVRISTPYDKSKVNTFQEVAITASNLCLE